MTAGRSRPMLRWLLSGAVVLLAAMLWPPPTTPQAVPSLAGQSTTLLPDGRWLLLGGENTTGPVATAWIRDDSAGTTLPLGSRLAHARAWHTATVLPDGTVLIAGGVGQGGRLVGEVEIVRPDTAAFATVIGEQAIYRAGHTATLLTDGRVLLVGGIGPSGRPVATAELWHAPSGNVEPVQAAMAAARTRHDATLQADGSVRLSGGVGDTASVPADEVFEPGPEQFTVAAALHPLAPRPARLEASQPVDKAQDVPVDTVVALRFSGPLNVGTVSAQTVLLSGPHGMEPARVIAAEGGRLVFLTPDSALQPGAAYAVSLNGIRDDADFPLLATAIQFQTDGLLVSQPTTAMPPGPSGSAPRGGSAPVAGASAAADEFVWKGPLRDGKPYSRWQDLPALQAPAGATALAGQILQLNGVPLADVTFSLAGQSTRSDHTGRFLLSALPPGKGTLLIDGRSASRPQAVYGVFEVLVVLEPGRTNVLDYTIWMPKIDTANAVTIPSPTASEVVVTNPRMPDFELRIPAGAVITDHEHQRVTHVSLTPMPLDRPVYPGPQGGLIMRMTIQPGSGYVYHSKGARLHYANVTREQPGARMDFFQYDPRERGWYVYGEGTVSEDGRQIIPDPGVAIYEFTGASAQPPNLTWRTVAASYRQVGSWLAGGDPVDLSTGLFIMEKTDLLVPDVIPLALTRTYRQGDTTIRRFGRGMTHPYDIFLWSANPYQEVDLILPDGGRVHYVRISPGTGYSDAEFEHTASPTAFYGSRIKWNATSATWDLSLKDGRVWMFDKVGSLRLLVDRWGNVVRMGTTIGGTGLRISAPHGGWLELIDDHAARVAQAVDSSGRVVSYTYDGDGRLTSVTDAQGGVTEYTWDASHRLVTIRDARGIVYLTNEYDTNDRVIRQTQADSTTWQFAYTLDGNGKVIQTDVTDPRGYVRRATFSAAGYPLTDTRAFGTALAQTVTYQLQASTNLVESVTDALGRQTGFTYDGAGNVLTVTRLVGTGNAVTTTLTYEPTFHQVATVTDPLSHTTTYTYDPVGNLTAITDPLGKTTTVTYNAVGQPVTITDPLNHTTQLGYAAGLLTTLTDPTGFTTTITRDAAGRPAMTTNPLGQASQTGYDALNAVTQAVDPHAGATRLAYDPNGNLLSLTDARGSVTGYAYNSMDRVTTRTDPLSRAESYGYDANGNLTSVTDRKSQTTTLTYDALDRPTGRTFQDGSTITYTWDAGNRLTQVVDSIAGTITRTYDGLDRLLTETTPTGGVTYTYDAAGRRATMTVGGQAQITYGYDNADRLTSITQGSAVVTLEYDDAGRRTRLTLPNGVTTEYGYDAASRLTSRTYKHGANTLGALTYTYDAVGRRTSVGGTWARTLLPDALTGATYNAANHQVTFGGQALTYDLNGNLTDDGTNTYAWTARDQLASITGPTAASFVYDALGRRQRKTIGGTITDFVYDGLTPVREATGATIVDLLTGLGIDEYLIRTTGSTTENYLVDPLGSTVALADGAGAVATEYSYEPFGAVDATGATSGNEKRYTGREDDGTGLDYYRARYYHPQLQRFISEDPIGLEGGDANLYVYVGNNPVGFVDPLGLEKEECTFSKRLVRNFLAVNEPLFKRPVTSIAGLLATAEVRRIFGTPTIGQFVRSGFAPLRGYQPLAQTLGIVGAGVTAMTVGQSAATVAAGAGVKSGLILLVFEGGVIVGATVNAGIVQPLLGPSLGITGCEG